MAINFRIFGFLIGFLISTTSNPNPIFIGVYMNNENNNGDNNGAIKGNFDRPYLHIEDDDLISDTISKVRQAI